MPSMQRGVAEGVVGPQLVVHGRLRGKCSLRVDGVVEGEVELDGTLGIGPDGTVVGPCRARSVEVAGELHGEVVAESVALRAGGLVQGDVRARRVAIDDGAALHGAVEMDFALEEGLEDDEDVTDVFTSADGSILATTPGSTPGARR